MSQISNQLRSYAEVVSGSPPTPTLLITPLLPVAALPGTKAGVVGKDQGGSKAGCIWHDDPKKSCLCPISPPLEVARVEALSMKDKEIKKDGVDKEGDTEKVAEGIEGHEETAKSRWSKTVSQLIDEAVRRIEQLPEVPSHGVQPQSRFAGRWAGPPEMKERRRQLVRECGYDYQQVCQVIEAVSKVNRSLFDLTFDELAELGHW